MRVAFIVNPHSGPRRGRDPHVVERVRAAASGCGIDPTIELTTDPGHAEQLARRAAADGFAVVAAVGGDGTVNEVARGIMGSAAALAIVPVGSGNGFARDLGVSLDPDRACRQIAGGTRRLVDVGKVDEHLFLMTAGFAIDARVTHRFHVEAARRRGQLPYYTLGLRTYLSYRPPCLRLHANGVERALEPLLLVAANTRQYGGGAIIAPLALPDDGLLDLVIVPPLGVFRAARYAARLFSGTLDRAPGIEILRVSEAEVRGDVPLEAQVDGEPVLLGERAVLRCLPRALALWGPRP